MNRRGVRYFREEPERVAVGSRMPEDDEANDEMSTELEGLIRDVSRTAPVTPGSWRHFLGGLLALGAWPLCSMLGAPDNIQAMAMMLSGVWAGYHIGLSTREDCVSAWANYARYLRRELGTLD